MGFFSFLTQDTDKSIASSYSNRPTFTVHMVDDKGNVWKEENYEGYGEFGGKDYYELLSEMNGGTGDRSEGISMAFDGDGTGRNPSVKHPNLVEVVRGWEYTPEAPFSCPDQGYFYSDEEDDSYEYEDDDWNDDEGDSTQYDD